MAKKKQDGVWPDVADLRHEFEGHILKLNGRGKPWLGGRQGGRKAMHRECVGCGMALPIDLNFGRSFFPCPANPPDEET